MKFVADENVPIELIEKLRNTGYDFIRIDEYYKDMTDEEVVELAQKEDAIIVTFDKDFGEMVFRRKIDV